LYDKANKLLNDEMEPTVRDTDSIGPDILYEELEKALSESELKNRKVIGIDCIPAEIFKALAHTGKKNCLKYKRISTEVSD